MGFVSAKPFVFLLELSVLLLSFINVLSWAEPPHHNEPPLISPIYPPHRHGGYHHKVHPPVPSPSEHDHHHKGYPPVHPPIGHQHHHKGYPPVHPPIGHQHHHKGYPRKSSVAVEGVVFCKSCKYNGVPTLWGASPLFGAVVRLKCSNNKYSNNKYPLTLVQETKTDKNGYFFIMAPKTITTFESHECKVYIVSSPLKRCNVPTDLHYGVKGATPMRLPKLPPAPPQLPFEIYTVGPFAFESSPKSKCTP